MGTRLALALALDTGGTIFEVRGVRVMLDEDLARLYGVPTKALNQAVRRNADRFPSDFMFELAIQELRNLRSQSVTSSDEPGRHGGRRFGAFAFTEQGVAMLSSVLNTPRAIAVNIEIMRAFVRLRTTGDDVLRKRLDEMEKQYDKKFVVVFKAMRALMDVEAARRVATPKRQIGFRADET